MKTGNFAAFRFHPYLRRCRTGMGINMFFSVGVPVYNAEKYLDQCIESIMSQTEQDFELILVDDGSKDKSREICKCWEEKYPHKVRYIYKENSGSLLTRRRCFAESHGEYVYIVDADDYLVDRDALKIIKEKILKTKADMVFFSATISDTKPYVVYPFSEDVLFEGIELEKIYTILCDSDDLNSIWNKVFSRGLIDWENEELYKQKITNGTDMYQVIPLIFNANRILYIDRVLYHYRFEDNVGSIVHSFKSTVYDSLKHCYIRLYKAAESKSKNWEKLEPILQKRFLMIATTSAYKIRMAKDDQKKEAIDYLKSICQDTMFVENYKHTNKSSLPFTRRVLAFFMVKKLYLVIWYMTRLLN